jgi:hypothetical protein
MTDAQAKPPATAFIGFGGVVVREAVQRQADWFITDFHDLIYILQQFATISTTTTTTTNPTPPMTSPDK